MSYYILVQAAMQEIKSEIKLEGDEVKTEGEWRTVQSTQRPVFSQIFAGGVQRLQVPIQVYKALSLTEI